MPSVARYFIWLNSNFRIMSGLTYLQVYLYFGNCLSFLKCFSLIYSFSHASNSVRVKQITFIIPPTPITNFSQIYLPFSYSQIIKLAAVHLWIINSCYFSLKNPFLSCHTRFDIFFLYLMFLFTYLYLTLIIFYSHLLSFPRILSTLRLAM